MTTTTNGEAPVYVSRVRIERRDDGVRPAWLPAETEPVLFGTHGPVAEHYGKKADEIKTPHATTLDYIVAATGG